MLEETKRALSEKDVREQRRLPRGPPQAPPRPVTRLRTKTTHAPWAVPEIEEKWTSQWNDPRIA